MFSCFGESHDAGGVATLFPDVSDTNVTFTGVKLIPGRALRVSVRNAISGCTLIHYNVHNYDLSTSDLNRLLSSLSADLDRAQINPESISVVLVGDFNLPPGAPMSLLQPVPQSSSCVPARPFAGRWQQIFNKLLEVHDDVPTHYTSSSKTLSRIDRIFISSPSWMALQLRLNISLKMDPEAVHAEEISDHTPITLPISARDRLDRDAQPIPPHVFKLPGFASWLSTLTDMADLQSLSVLLRLRRFKELMLEAARLTRNDALLKGKVIQVMVARSIARAVWRQDARLAARLVAHSTLARRHIVLPLSSCIVNVVNQVAFSAELSDLNSNAANERELSLRRRADEVRSGPSHRISSTSACCRSGRRCGPRGAAPSSFPGWSQTELQCPTRWVSTSPCSASGRPSSTTRVSSRTP